MHHTTQEAAAWVAQTETPTGADRRAQRVRPIPEAARAADSEAEAWVRGAIRLLWALIDTAVAQVNAALARRGLAERIAVRRTSHEYWLTTPGPDGAARCVAFLVSLRTVHGHAQGGAHVTTSQTRARIDLVPTTAGGRLRWLVPAAEREFTAQVVDDLLLSVFSGPAAAARLDRYFTTDAAL
jgi:predicted NBD/HSP70 family sugar kinase